MRARKVEDEIKKLGTEVSKIYFDAKDELANAQDSRNERSTTAARIVRAFRKRLENVERNACLPL
jgi:uncharacterized protein (UPF0335 family)